MTHSSFCRSSLEDAPPVLPSRMTHSLFKMLLSTNGTTVCVSWSLCFLPGLPDRLLSSIKPALVKKINRLPTPIAGLVSPPWHRFPLICALLPVLRTSHLYLPLSSISLFHLHYSCHSSWVGVKLMTVWVRYHLVFIIVQQSGLCRTCQSWSYTISLFMFQRSKKKKERKASSRVSHVTPFCPAEFGISYLEEKKTQHHLKQKLPTYPRRSSRRSLLSRLCLVKPSGGGSVSHTCWDVDIQLIINSTLKRFRWVFCWHVIFRLDFLPQKFVFWNLKIDDFQQNVPVKGQNSILYFKHFFFYRVRTKEHRW